MLEPSPSFSRVRSLLQTAGNGNSAGADAGEAGVFASMVGGEGVDGEGVDGEGVAALEDRLTRLESVELAAVHRESARSGSFGAWPDRLDPRLLAGLARGPMTRPYVHQAEALEAILRGEDVVLATSTASGKSICFQLPVLHAVLSAPSSRALMLFPTKALARDQVESMRTLAESLGVSAVGMGLYDGDTPPDARRAARARAHAIASNPDMLHRGVLPHHERWGRFLGALRYVVVDELHVYRGLFGSHVANVLRRLWRLCRHYGSAPQFIACSATIANPGELACGLSGRTVRVVDRDGAPRGARTFVVLNPQVVDPLTGVRRDYLKVTRDVTDILRTAGVQTLAFCRTRKAVELLTRYMQDEEARDQPEVAPTQAIRGYRGGYLPERRREVERALRSGEARVVAATHALELGIDIGGVDAVVLSGYPGTRAATRQRAGRAGRRGRPSLTVLCLSSNPLDQFVASEPSFLWEPTVEHARIDPNNPEVLLPHLRCATSELGFGDVASLAKDWPGLEAAELHAALTYLAEHGGVVRHVLDAPAIEADDPMAQHAPAPHSELFVGLAGSSPAEEVDLRGTIEENFSVIEEPTGDILAEVDYEDAPLYVHVGAMYPIEGRFYEVRQLDWEARKAYVRLVRADYYTEAICKLRVRVLGGDERDSGTGEGGHGPSWGPSCGQGWAHVVRSVPGFKKIRLGTHENIGFGPVSLPDLELHTSAAYWASPRAFSERVAEPERRAATALAVAHALHHVAAMLLMCDRGDLAAVVTGGHPSAWGPVLLPNRRPTAEQVLAAGACPYIVLYDRAPGGAGLASAASEMSLTLLRRARTVVAACRCGHGCPTCMGPASDDAWEADRGDVLAWLELATLSLDGGAA